MKYYLTLLLCGLFYLQASAQTNTYTEKLYYTCKVWGFVKYYHSRVSNCQVNWDSVLKDRLPVIKAAGTNADFNIALEQMIDAAGSMAIATNPLPDTLPGEKKRNRDWGWIANPVLSNSVQTKLGTIKDNFLPHPICWVQKNISNPNAGWLEFPYDDPAINVNTVTNFPGEADRVLQLCKYWNIINYFNPYNYVLDTLWDTTLYRYATAYAAASNTNDLFDVIDRMATNLNDAHAEGRTSTTSFLPYEYVPQILLRYIDNKYVVVKSKINGIVPGDVIISMDGQTTQQIEDKFRPYISAGNPSVFHRYMAQYIIAGSFGSTTSVVYQNQSGANNTITLTRSLNKYYSWFQSYYPTDSLRNTDWTTLDCNVGYVNMGVLVNADVNSMYTDLFNKPAIIFDMRNYPNGTAWTIADLIYPNKTVFARDFEPDVTYPGTFTIYEDALGTHGNTNPYMGKVIILMDQETQSQAEYSCMILEAMPDVVKIGSQTAGADGNISYTKLATNIQAGFTTLGIYYPNGDSTQRIGIVPDIVVKPTRAGISQGKDEVLDKAREIACALSVSHVHKQEQLSIYPNPVQDMLHIKMDIKEKLSITIMDMAGKSIMMKEFTAGGNVHNIDTKGLPPGIYLIDIRTGNTHRTTKFVK